MIIKKLLLGSAALLVTVAGARAADVIVPAAEPAEYVKVCNVYGEGFYYIPGTETCMQVSGYVRFKYNVNGDTIANQDGDNYDARSNVRVRLNFDVREETELGTLRAFARVQATNDGSIDNDAGYGMDLGYIQLGGLTMGYLDTLWTEGDGLLTDTDLALGDFQVNRISYVASYGAWSFGGSVEDSPSTVTAGASRFSPNGVLRAAYESDLFSAYVAGAIESHTDDVTTTFTVTPGGTAILTDDGDDAAVALKAGISFKPVQDGELKFEGSYAFDPTNYSSLGLYSGPFNNTQAITIGGGVVSFTQLSASLPVEWQAGAGYAQKFGKLGLGVAGAYGETFDYVGSVTAGGVTTVTNFGSGDYYKVVGNVGYEITNNFDVLGEVSYTNVDFDNGSLDQTSGFLQFVRSF